MNAQSPAWWPVSTRRCHADLIAYRLVGPGACADRIMTALVDLAAAAEESGRPVDIELLRAGHAFRALMPDTALYLNMLRHLLAVPGAPAASPMVGPVAGADTEATAAAACAARAQALRAYRGAALVRIVESTVEELAWADTVLVHDYNNTVGRILTALGRDRPRRVLVTAGEPHGQGVRTAKLAAAAGHRVVFLPDASVARQIHQVDVFVTGVETFYRNGSLSNAVGTLMFALLCREYSVDVLAPAELLKRHPDRIDVGPDELSDRLSYRWPAQPAAIEPAWEIEDHLLDAVPARLVSNYITEVGTLLPDEVSAEFAPMTVPG